jgi:FtsZ-binding cell division protein ZapB
MSSELLEHLTKKKKTAISTISSIDLKSAAELKKEEFFFCDGWTQVGRWRYCRIACTKGG